MKPLRNIKYQLEELAIYFKLPGKKLFLVIRIKKNKKSRKLPARKKILEIASNSNQIWSMDFMSGKFNGRKFRTFNIIDEWAREGLGIEISNSINSRKVIEILEKLISFTKRKPLAIRTDNGSEFTSYDFVNWARNKNISYSTYKPVNLIRIATLKGSTVPTEMRYLTDMNLTQLMKLKK